jgi:hypothetical protein
VREQQLNDQIDELRRRRNFMTPQDFDAAFEKLAIELATVSGEIRAKSAATPPARP